MNSWNSAACISATKPLTIRGWPIEYKSVDKPSKSSCSSSFISYQGLSILERRSSASEVLELPADIKSCNSRSKRTDSSNAGENLVAGIQSASCLVAHPVRLGGC